MPVLDDEEIKERPSRRLDVLFNIALFCVILGGVLGASMAWMNASISPPYFQETMGWNLEEARPASLIQGSLRGLAYGFAFAIFFALVCGWATRFQCSFSFALRQVFKVSLFVILGWITGGVIESTFFQPTGQSTAFPLAYWHARWVHGAILGQEAGFLLGIVFCPFIVWRAWRKEGVD